MHTDNGPSGVVWSRVHDGFFVGSMPGRFLGCIDTQADGTYVAMDVFTKPIGTFADLRLAMAAVHDVAVEGASA